MSVRDIARVCGRLMSMYVVLGLALRVMTRAMYILVAEETGMPPDCSRRKLRVAWDKTTRIDVCDAFLAELAFWEAELPGIGPAPIYQIEPAATLVAGTDASDTAWAGLFDDGSGAQRLARDLLKPGEGAESSTLREVKGSLRNLQASRRRWRSTGASTSCS